MSYRQYSQKTAAQQAFDKRTSTSIKPVMSPARLTPVQRSIFIAGLKSSQPAQAKLLKDPELIHFKNAFNGEIVFNKDEARVIYKSGQAIKKGAK